MTAHKQVMHNGLASAKEALRVFPCTQCDYVGTQMGNLNAHIRTQHGATASGETPIHFFSFFNC